VKFSNSQVLTAGALAAVLALSGCSGDQKSSGGSANGSNGAVEITFWHSASGAAAEVVDQAVKDFNSANEGKIKVTSVYQGKYDDAMTKFTNGIRSKNLPDVMQVNDINTQYMIDTKVTLSAKDLNDASETKLNLDDIIPVVSTYYSTDGQLRSIPFQTSQPVLFVNPVMAKAAGLDVANPPKTVAEVAEWARKIASATKKGGIVFHKTPWWVEEMTASANLEYCTPDNGSGKEPATKFKLTDPKQIAQWKTLQDLYTEKVAVNVGVDGNAAQTTFSRGDAGLLFGSSAAVGNVTKNAKFTPVLVPFPTDAEGGGAVPGGNSLWVIGKDAKGSKEQAAYAFQRYLVSEKVQADSFTKSGYLPNTKPAVEKLTASADANQKVLLEQLAKTPQNTATGGCHSGAMQEVRKDLQKQLDTLLGEGGDLEKSFAEVEARSEEAIQTYIKRAAK
jgi:sn-glycerol 3-phosphate transport system substrate-binding protein